MIDLLPTVNACLNLTSALLLLSGRWHIANGRKAQHRLSMLASLFVSLAFLTSYLTYHYFHGTTRFGGEGIVRTLYFVILVSHTILAVVVAPLVLITLRRALKEQWERHKRLARWTFPIWLYVSVTGVIVYIMLYRLGFAA